MTQANLDIRLNSIVTLARETAEYYAKDLQQEVDALSKRYEFAQAEIARLHTAFDAATALAARAEAKVDQLENLLKLSITLPEA